MYNKYDVIEKDKAKEILNMSNSYGALDIRLKQPLNLLVEVKYLEENYYEGMASYVDVMLGNVSYTFHYSCSKLTDVSIGELKNYNFDPRKTYNMVKHDNSFYTMIRVGDGLYLFVFSDCGNFLYLDSEDYSNNRFNSVGDLEVIKSSISQTMDSFSMDIKVSRIVHDELEELLRGSEDLDRLLADMIETYKTYSKERLHRIDDFIKRTGVTGRGEIMLPEINIGYTSSQEDYLATERIYNNYVSQKTSDSSEIKKKIIFIKNPSNYEIIEKKSNTEAVLSTLKMFMWEIKSELKLSGIRCNTKGFGSRSVITNQGSLITEDIEVEIFKDFKELLTSVGGIYFVENDIISENESSSLCVYIQLSKDFHLMITHDFLVELSNKFGVRVCYKIRTCDNRQVHDLFNQREE